MDVKTQELGAVSENRWQPIRTAPEGELVLTKIHDGAGSRNEQPMIRKGRLWFIGSDYGTYVYYAPTHWKQL